MRTLCYRSLIMESVRSMLWSHLMRTSHSVTFPYIFWEWNEYCLTALRQLAGHFVPCRLKTTWSLHSDKNAQMIHIYIYKHALTRMYK